MSTKRVVNHPVHQRNIQTAASRWMLYRDQHAKACDRMWRGMLSEFHEDELDLLRGLGYFSEHDERIIASLKARA